MALSKYTLEILRYFSKINPNLDLIPGRILRTIHPLGDIACEAKIDQDITMEVSITNLERFLAVYRLSQGARILSFGITPEGIVIRDRRGTTIYAEVSSVQNRSLYEKPIKFSESDNSIRFVLSPTDLKQMMRHTRILKLKHLTVYQTGLMLSHKQKRLDTVMFPRPNNADPKTEIVFLMEYIKMLMPLYYRVTIEDNKAKFSSLDSRLKIDYFVAAENENE